MRRRSRHDGAFMDKLGVWLIGARGSVATTAIVGASALRAGVTSPDLPELLAADLDAVDAEIRPGHVAGHGGRAAARLIDDIAGFRARHGLARVVVVNVSSTEPPWEPRPEFERLGDLEERL